MSTEELKSLAALKELSTASGSEVDKLAEMAKTIALLKEQLVDSKKPSTMAKALAAQAIKAKKELATQDEIILQFKSDYKKKIADYAKEYFEQLKMLKEHRAELAQNANPCRVWGDEPEPLPESDCEVNDEQGSAHGSAHGSNLDSENYRESYTQVAKKRSPKPASNDVPKKPETMANYVPKPAYKNNCKAGDSCRFRINCTKRHPAKQIALFKKENQDWCAGMYAKNSNFRSQWCDNMVKTGYCRHGKLCNFMHPDDEEEAFADSDPVHQQTYY